MRRSRNYPPRPRQKQNTHLCFGHHAGTSFCIFWCVCLFCAVLTHSYALAQTRGTGVPPPPSVSQVDHFPVVHGVAHPNGCSGRSRCQLAEPQPATGVGDCRRPCDVPGGRCYMLLGAAGTRRYVRDVRERCACLCACARVRACVRVRTFGRVRVRVLSPLALFQTLQHVLWHRPFRLLQACPE